jgi:Mn-dependent DtxR family transcriptional regulator
MTKDESFLLKLHELASKGGEPFALADRYAIGRAIGQNDKGVDNMVNMLAKTNFIKKGEEMSVCLTPHGLRFVEELRKGR